MSADKFRLFLAMWILAFPFGCALGQLSVAITDRIGRWLYERREAREAGTPEALAERRAHQAHHRALHEFANGFLRDEQAS